MATRGYDLFADGIADNRSIMGGAALHDARVDNALAYVSPTFGGVTIVGAGVFGSSTPMANSTKANVWSLAALYAGGPFTGTFAYQTIQFGSAGTGTFGAAGNAPANLIGGNVYALAVNDKTTAWKIGGSYTMDAFLINAVYEKVTFTPNAAGTDQLDQGDWYVAGKYSVSANDAVKLAFTEAGTQTKVNNGSNNGAKQWTVGYDHNMSKHTTVYALYSKLTNDSGADYTFNQGTSAASANGGVGSAPSVFSIGMKHAF
jgi:predicted porin